MQKEGCESAAAHSKPADLARALEVLERGPNERQLCVYSFCGGLIVEIHDSVRLRLN